MFALVQTNSAIRRIDSEDANASSVSDVGGVIVNAGGVVIPATPEYADRYMAGEVCLDPEVVGLFEACLAKANRVVRENVRLLDAYFNYVQQLCVSYTVPAELLNQSISGMERLGGSEYTTNSAMPPHPSVSPAFVYNGEATACVTIKLSRKRQQ